MLNGPYISRGTRDISWYASRVPSNHCHADSRTARYYRSPRCFMQQCHGCYVVHSTLYMHHPLLFTSVCLTIDIVSCPTRLICVWYSHGRAQCRIYALDSAEPLTNIAQSASHRLIHTTCINKYKGAPLCGPIIFTYQVMHLQRPTFQIRRAVTFLP